MQPHILLDGLAMPESPRWHDDRLWFSNWGTRQIVAVDLGGNSNVVGEGPDGLGWLRTGSQTGGCSLPARGWFGSSATGRTSDTPISATSRRSGGARSPSTPRPPCFATMLGGPDRRTLFMLTADWRGTKGVEDVIKAKTGQVLVVEAPASGVGWP